MRQKLSLLTKTMLLLGALMAGSVLNSVSATETTITKTTNEIISANSFAVSADQDVTIYDSFSLDANIQVSTSGDPNCGSFWGTTTKDWRLYQTTGGDVTITAVNGCELKSVTLTYSISNSGTLKDGSTTVASGTKVDVSGTSKTFTVGNTGNKTNGQVRITQFSVTYEEPSSAVATTVTIDATGITNTDVKAGTAAGTLIATVAAGETTIEGATVTWSSNNTAVATVGETTGVVTLVAAGEAKITASYAGVAGTYKSSSADYDLSVTDSRTVPTLTFDPATLPTLTTDDEDLPLTLTTDYDGTITAASSDDSKATITATASNQWTISPKSAGNVTFTFSGDATANYKAANATLSLTVAAGTSLKLNKTVVVSDWSPVSGSYYTTATDVTIDGVKFNLYQCCKQTDLQLKSGSGVLTSPIIKSENGYTVILTTGSGSNASGELTLQIGSEKAVTVSGADNIVLATTSSKSASFTVKNLSSKMMRITKIVIMPNLYVTSNGWATFITPAAMEFAAETAYIVTAVDEDEGTITIDDVTAVPANTPLLVKGEGVKAVSVPATAPSAPAGNLLSVSDGSAPASGYYNYVLAKDGDGAGFKQWTGDASTLKDRVVLVLDFAKSEARMLRFVESDTQGISAALMNKETMNDVVYDLQGRSVAQPTKGLYIVNGKKVIMK